MKCLHPYCPSGAGPSDWEPALDAAKIGSGKRAAVRANLMADFSMAPSATPVAKASPTSQRAVLDRLLRACPCLFNQIAEPATARGTIHLCEITLGGTITSANVYDAFVVQHPGLIPNYAFPPLAPCKSGGDIMEMLCSEVLDNEGIPAMTPFPSGADEGWPEWNMPGHILLNERRMRELKAFGDILIPCGPTNLVISVKSEAAKERLLYSSNAIEGVGFGFFRHPHEFWKTSRMKLYKRMGFSAIYMPTSTWEAVRDRLAQDGTAAEAVNVNGSPLYRPLTAFGADMRRVVGKSSLHL